MRKIQHTQMRDRDRDCGICTAQTHTLSTHSALHTTLRMRLRVAFADRRDFAGSSVKGTHTKFATAMRARNKQHAPHTHALTTTERAQLTGCARTRDTQADDGLAACARSARLENAAAAATATATARALAIV